MGIGCIIDGVPPKLPLSERLIQPYLDRRRPGTSKFVTQRKEDDQVEILSGVFEGKTTPLSTYEFQNMKIGQPPDSFFQLPEQYTHESCDRQVGGFPYIHAFLHYLKF